MDQPANDKCDVLGPIIRNASTLVIDVLATNSLTGHPIDRLVESYFSNNASDTAKRVALSALSEIAMIRLATGNDVITWDDIVAIVQRHIPQIVNQYDYYAI